ncbi:MAG: tetratricopeptide repeat protein, partial [Verrucomicrobiae bacterium]|nr:tetratricopeptide repeat protein [Verrucomicrobiae bacterium]
MSFFRKLFGARKASSPTPGAIPAGTPKTEGEPIRVFDKFGRELLIERRDWVNLMHDNLREHWNEADPLASHIIQALQDGFDAEVEEAAKRLHDIDTDPSRGATLLAIVYLQTQRPAEAEKVLRAHISRHGEEGVVLTNLAKAQAALGRDEESLDTLWRALELDPNQDNGLGWYEVIHREKEGEKGSIEALRRIAGLPGSWRARLWLARHELAEKRLNAALTLYREALERAPRPVPSDLLMQLSGDLGNQGHLIELLDLTSPHFDPEAHGLTVGNNLIKASIDTGQLSEARKILDQLEAMQRPDWRETLSFWEAELQKARIDSEEVPTVEQLQVTMLTISGAIWLPEEHPIAGRFPVQPPDAPHVVVSGSTFESPSMGDKVTRSPSDLPGRYSRALPLFFAEHLAHHSSARTTTLIPWIVNGFGGFVLGGKAYSDEDLASLGSRAVGENDAAPDYVLGSHLIVRGENVTVWLRLIRCIDGRRLGEVRRDFPEAAFHRAADSVLEDLAAILAREAQISVSSAVPTLAGAELDHYLFRLEQALAVSCSTMKEAFADSLSNPAEILDGMLQL